jgi:hypothetical protein
MAACRSFSVGLAAACRVCQTETASESTSAAELYWPERTASSTIRSIRGETDSHLEPPYTKP